MKIHHSEKTLLFVFIPLVSTIILLTGLLSLLCIPAFYVFTGLLIWIVLSGEPNFLKTLVLWWPAIVLDNTELIE